MKEKNMKVQCPICDANVVLTEDTEVTELLICSDCQSRLVVESLGSSPLLGEAPMIEEDWGE
jgi:lysine biosynthesis protein LysW